MTLNQSITVGADDNPFFGFYEGPLDFPLNKNDGSVERVKAIHFLNNVRQGNITPNNLANDAYRIARHYVMLVRELIMEDIRLAEVPDAPSRQRCLFACDTLDEARYWKDRIGDDSATICALRAKGTIHRADARLLLADSEPLSVTKDRARRYWRGEMSDNPEPETLFEGDAVVTEIGL